MRGKDSCPAGGMTVNNFVNLLKKRSSGCLKPTQFSRNLIEDQLSGLNLSECSEFVQESHSAGITSVALDREDHQFLLVGLGDGTICVHNLFGRRKACGYTSTVELRVGRGSRFKHNHAINTVSWYVDNGMFLTSGRDGKLKVWDSNEGTVVEEFAVGGTINKHCVAHPEVGPIVAVTNDTNHLHLVDLNTGSTCHTLRGHEAEVITCVWSRANPRILASGGADKKIMLWDVRQAKSFLASLDFNNVRFKRNSELKLAGMSHQSAVHGLEYSPCGRYLVSLGNDNRLRKWDTVTLKNLKTRFPELKIKCKGSVELICTEGGRSDYLLMPEHNNVAVFNMITGKRAHSLVGHYNSVHGLAYSSYRMCLYSGGRDRFVLQWDIPMANRSSQASKVDITSTKPLNPYTVDNWSSDED